MLVNHGPLGGKNTYWLLDGREVGPLTFGALCANKLLIPNDDGLFPGAEQSWRVT